MNLYDRYWDFRAVTCKVVSHEQWEEINRIHDENMEAQEND